MIFEGVCTFLGSLFIHLYNVYFNNDEALEKFILSDEYSFERQKASCRLIFQNNNFADN